MQQREKSVCVCVSVCVVCVCVCVCVHANAQCSCWCEEMQTDRKHVEARSDQTLLKCETESVCVFKYQSCAAVSKIQPIQLSCAITSLLSDHADLNERASLP